MSDGGSNYDNQDANAHLEQAASLMALNQRADQVQASYGTIATGDNVPPERQMDFGRAGYISNVVSMDEVPPNRRNALERKLKEYKGRFEKGIVFDRIAGSNKTSGEVRLFHEQAKVIGLQLLLENGSLNLDALKQSFVENGMIDPENAQRYEEMLNDAYYLVYDYANTGGMRIGGGTGLVETDEQEQLRDLVHKSVPEVWSAARKLASDYSEGELKPVEYKSDDGKDMKARLMKQHGHVSSDEGGVVAELTETHNGVDVGVKQYVYLGYNWFNAQNGQTSHIYRAARLGNHVNILKEPLGFISAKPGDYPDGESYWLTAGEDEDATERNASFLGVVGTFGSLVEANKK
jgi:hypothetical protein